MDRAGIYHTAIAKGTHHKGPRQAGNKSLISFRAGHGLDTLHLASLCVRLAPTPFQRRAICHRERGHIFATEAKRRGAPALSRTAGPEQGCGNNARKPAVHEGFILAIMGQRFARADGGHVMNLLPCSASSP